MSPLHTEPDPEGFEQLKEMQRLMSAALFRPLASGERMQARWVDGQAMRKVAATFIKPNDRLTSFERLEIYNRVYWFRVWDCLYDDFPALQVVLGSRRFHRLITAYLAEFPSESYTLRDLGSRMERYLRQHPEFIPAGKTELVLDTVRFEWAQVTAFDDEARTPINIDDLLGQDPSTLTLTLQPHLALLALDYPIDDFLLQVKERDDGSMRSETSNVAVSSQREAVKKLRMPKRQRTYVAVHRHDNMLFYKRLEPAAFAILEALRRGKPLAEACEAGAIADPQADLSTLVGEWFRTWAALGWFCEPKAEDVPEKLTSEP